MTASLAAMVSSRDEHLCLDEHRQMLRELSRLVNAEIREARDLVDTVSR